MARRHGDAFDGCVHPCELGLRISHVEQPAWIGPDEHPPLSVRHGPPRKMGEDILDDGPALLADEVRLSGASFSHALDGQDVPQGGVCRVIGRSAVSIAHEIRHEPAAHLLSDLGKDLFSLLDPARKEREPGERDEGIPPPGAEPVVAGRDKRFPAVFDEEARAFTAQVLKDRFLIQGGSCLDFLPERSRSVCKGRGARRDPCGAANAKAAGKNARHEQVILPVVAAFAFDGVEDMVVPVRSRLEGRPVHPCAGHLHDERRGGSMGAEGKSGMGIPLRQGVERSCKGWIGMVQVIGRPAADQRPRKKFCVPAGGSAGRVQELITDEQAAFACAELYGTAQEHASAAGQRQAEHPGDFVHGACQPAFQLPAFRPCRSGVKAAGEGVFTPLDAHAVFQGRKEHELPFRGLGAKQSVIAPRGAASCRA